tara:strand:- start:405 stop:1175 length:771 start_codon:yes stop_codon:yes gene_type:complete
MKNQLSVLLVVSNEEKQILDCLKTIQFANEIVIILDKCTDNSEIIAKKFTKKIFKGSWNIEGDRRNFGISQCSNKWVFEIDADERVSLALQEEIKFIINNTDRDFFLIDVENYVGSKLVKFGWGAYFGKSSYPGLFKKKFKIWGNERVHPKLKFTTKKSGKLKNCITHYYCKNLSDMILKLDKYSTARALDLNDKNINETFFKNFKRIFSRFWKCYVLRKGYKEKEIGFFIAIMASLYPIVSYIKSKDLSDKSNIY